MARKLAKKAVTKDARGEIIIPAANIERANNILKTESIPPV